MGRTMIFDPTKQTILGVADALSHKDSVLVIGPPSGSMSVHAPATKGKYKGYHRIKLEAWMPESAIVGSNALIDVGIAIMLRIPENRVAPDLKPEEEPEVESDWAYSYNGENYTGSFKTKEEAIEVAISEADDEDDLVLKTIWVGKAVKPTISVSADHLLEEAAEYASEQCGEYADGYLEKVDKNAREILNERVNEVFSKWMKEFKYEPEFFKVVEDEIVERPE